MTRLHKSWSLTFGNQPNTQGGGLKAVCDVEYDYKLEEDELKIFWI